MTQTKVRPETKPSTPRLSEICRHLVIPEGIVTTGWPDVKWKAGTVGIEYDPWQDQLGAIILGKRANGKYAATIGGVKLSIPRQVGKTFFVGTVVMMLCLLYPGLTVVWTAHRTRTSTQTFRTLQGFARSKRIKPFVEAIRRANGEQEIAFTNGSVIMFGAREQGFGRGFDEVDIEVFDEDQILTDKALEDLVAATNQSRFPAGALILYMGTPPRPGDPGEVAISRRREALSGEATDTVYLEAGADPDADPDDQRQWAKANFSFPHRTPIESMLRLRKQLRSLEGWLREGLGIWDEDVLTGVFSSGAWARCSTTERPGNPAAFGIAADLDQTRLSLGAVSDDERPHLAATLQSRFDTERAHFVAETKRLAGDLPVAIDKKGPASPLIDELKDAGVRLVQMGLDDKVQADADLREAVETRAVGHGNYPELNEAVDAATWRKVGEGRRAFGRSPMLEAVSLALKTTAQTYDLYKSFL